MLNMPLQKKKKWRIVLINFLGIMIILLSLAIIRINCKIYKLWHFLKALFHQKIVWISWQANVKIHFVLLIKFNNYLYKVILNLKVLYKVVWDECVIKKK